MAKDESGGGNPTQAEIEAGQRAGRKRVGENGLPQSPPTPQQQDAADRSKMTVTSHPTLCTQELDRVRGQK